MAEKKTKPIALHDFDTEGPRRRQKIRRELIDEIQRAPASDYTASRYSEGFWPVTPGRAGGAKERRGLTILARRTSDHTYHIIGLGGVWTGDDWNAPCKSLDQNYDRNERWITYKSFALFEEVVETAVGDPEILRTQGMPGVAFP